MFQVAFLTVVLFLVWLQSRWAETVHVVDGGTHVFKYNWVPWLFLGLLILTSIAFAAIAYKVIRDRFLTGACLLGIPLFSLLSLQLVCERVVITPELLVHRREPPHTRFNADIPWNSIVAAEKIKREKPGLFAPSFHNVGYTLSLSDGRTRELPSNTVLTHAQEEIDRMLRSRDIPVSVKTVPIPDP